MSPPPSALQQFAAVIARGIRDAEYEDLKQYFRLAGIVLDAPADPDAVEARTAFVLSEVRSLAPCCCCRSPPHRPSPPRLIYGAVHSG